MTGPEHYATAESLLSGVAAEEDPAQERLVVAYAQAHATLALAAATALASAENADYKEYEAWNKVAGVQRRPASR